MYGRGQSGRLTLQEMWATEACAACGEDLVLGEGITRVGASGRERLCAACAAKPALPSPRRVAAVPAGDSPAVVPRLRTAA